MKSRRLKVNQEVSVTLSYANWSELLEAAAEHIIVEAGRKRWRRPMAEQMLPCLKAHTQICRQSKQDGVDFRFICRVTYDQALKLFNPGMFADTKQRYEEELESGGIEILVSEPD